MSSNQERIKAMREGGQRLARVLQVVRQAVTPGISTAELDALAEQEIAKAGGTPSFKGYRGYPATLCTSVNETVVHGIPRSDVILKDGDIVGLDLGMLYQGFHTDMAVTVPVGAVPPGINDFIVAARKALRQGVSTAKAGITTGALGAAIQKLVEDRGFHVVRELVGHGVGVSIHEEPAIPNFGPVGAGVRLVSGQTIAIEPMLTRGKHQVETLADGWTVVTRDRSLAAHMEQTVVINKNGAEILTPFVWERY